MSYISEIFERADIQRICEFLLHGTEGGVTDRHSYKQRLDCARNDMLKLICLKYPEAEEREEITSVIYRFAGVCENVYMEIGLQSGAVLTAQVLQNAAKHSADERKQL